MLDPVHCRARQRRLLDAMSMLKLDAAVLSTRHHVYWLTGHWPFWLHESAAVLRADGHVTLFRGNAPEQPVPDGAVDDVQSFEASRFSTQRQEQAATVGALVGDCMTASHRSLSRVGFDTSPVAAHLPRESVQPVCVDDLLHQLRRRKHPDELALMRRAIDCTRAMYARAREVIRPGVREVDVFVELQAAAIREAGEALRPMHLGNDYVSGAGGGPPTPGKVAQAGELYILDLGPAYRGYFADNARVVCVDGKPTDAQRRAWEAVAGVFPIIERTARPGVRCRDLFDAGANHLLEHAGKKLDHHLGHGVGLQPHEFPHINPKWDDVLELGEVFTIEPGVYGPELNGGIRLENQYLVTETGVENLTQFGLELM